VGVTAETAQRKVELLARGRVVQFTGRDVVSAIELHRLNRLSFWDAMIVTQHGLRMPQFFTPKTCSTEPYWAA
jgi:predicted nucleic acid-binding protein